MRRRSCCWRAWQSGVVAFCIRQLSAITRLWLRSSWSFTKTEGHCPCGDSGGAGVCASTAEAQSRLTIPTMTRVIMARLRAGVGRPGLREASGDTSHRAYPTAAISPYTPCVAGAGRAHTPGGASCGVARWPRHFPRLPRGVLRPRHVLVLAGDLPRRPVGTRLYAIPVALLKTVELGLEGLQLGVGPVF